MSNPINNTPFMLPSISCFKIQTETKSKSGNRTIETMRTRQEFNVQDGTSSINIHRRIRSQSEHLTINLTLPQINNSYSQEIPNSEQATEACQLYKMHLDYILNYTETT